MSTSVRSELVAALIRLSERYPEMRFGQLLANVADWGDRSVWDVDDDELLAAARLHLDEVAERESVLRS